MTMSQEQKSGIERHVQTVVVAIVLALLMWNTKTTNENSILLARIDENMKNRQEQINRLSDRHNTTVSLVQAHEKRLDKIDATLWTERDHDKWEDRFKKWLSENYQSQR